MHSLWKQITGGLVAGVMILTVALTVAADTGNEEAAGGPIPGDLSLIEGEVAEAAKRASPGYFPSLNGAEAADAQRSCLFPAATFTGSHDGPNQVYAYRGETPYQGLTYITNRHPGELFLVGGDYPPPTGRMPPGPYIARADASTGRELWRTYVDNANVSGHWIGNANLNILPNGNIAFCWSTQIVLIDGDTGRILKHRKLPPGEAPAKDVNYKHMTIAPDGTLILKTQTRPTGSKEQGTMAIIKGKMAGLPQPNSHLAAVDPDTLEVLHDVSLPEPCSAPHIIADHHGRIATYIPMETGLTRYFWDPKAKQLSRDESWTLRAMIKGQTAATAATLIGDWVAVQTNGLGSSAAASSIVVAHRDDVSRMHSIFPFGDKLKPGGWSFCMPKAGGDPENHMLYSADMGVEKVAGIKIDPATGALTLAFVVDNATTTFQPLIGPASKRVLLLTNAKRASPEQTIQQAVFSARYTEQLTWRDAATGRILAASDFFEPLTMNSLTTPGYGGRVYFPTLKGLLILQALPKRAE